MNHWKRAQAVHRLFCLCKNDDCQRLLILDQAIHDAEVEATKDAMLKHTFLHLRCKLCVKMKIMCSEIAVRYQKALERISEHLHAQEAHHVCWFCASVADDALKVKL